MKLIALKDFAGVKVIQNLKLSISGFTPDPEHHHHHIPEGATFEIGTADNIKALQEEDAAKAQIVAQLIYAGCVGDANDEAVVAKVKKNIAVRKKREAAAAEADKKADLTSLANVLVAALTPKAAAAPAK